MTLIGQPDDSRFKLDKYLLKLCRKERLLELIHDFVLFDGGVKKLPRAHQYFGIKAAQEHVRRRQGGIIWHTQGSGKSPRRRHHRPRRARQVDRARLHRGGRAGQAHRQRRRADAPAREQLKEAVPPLLARWQPLLGVEAERWFVRRMKTRWGSCNHKARTIRLNTELAKKPAECLEYIVVHELVHLLEPTHSARFVALMDRFLPRWQFHRDVLNSLPLRRETWSY